MACDNGMIDIVLTWVDGDDMSWRRERDSWQNKMNGSVDPLANSDIRYQDWENLKYWFRAVEKNLPWVHTIFFITYGHIPSFLKVNHPKLRIIRHDEYIPSEFLPTFNSNTIEMNVWRIKELAENFVIFNDDFFPLQFINEDYYFKNNMVCDEAVESPIMPVDIGDISGWSCRMKANNILFLNRHFYKRDVQQKNYSKWFSEEYGELVKRNEGLSYWNNFCGFHDPHMANALKKSTIKKLWDVEPQTLAKASSNRFRAESDVSWYLARYWQLCTGEFCPRKTQGKPYLITPDNYEEVAEAIKCKKYQMISINEDCSNDEFKKIKLVINNAFEEVFPEKSSFEV